MSTFLLVSPALASSRYPAKFQITRAAGSPAMNALALNLRLPASRLSFAVPSVFRRGQKALGLGHFSRLQVAAIETR